MFSLMQKLDGFLSLLSITGGSWSPPLLKLPFSVTCFDGLLYYASINLTGNSANKRGKANESTKDDLSNDASVCKNRFRIPVCGRVQLVIDMLFLMYEIMLFYMRL
jgi:hypothetical protein